MSAKDIAEYSAQICVGALAVVSGGTTLTAVPAIAGLAAIGLAFHKVRLQTCHRTSTRAAVDALIGSREHTTYLDDARELLATDPPDQPPHLTQEDIVRLRDTDRARFAANLANVLAAPYAQYAEQGTLEVIRLAFATTLRSYIASEEFRNALNDAQTIEIAQNVISLRANVNRIELTTETILAEQRKQNVQLQDRMLELTDRLATMHQAEQARSVGISEATLIRLANRIAKDVSDGDAALIELTRAVEIAVRVQHEGSARSNHGDFVNEVLSRVAALSRDGAYGDAVFEIEEALAHEESTSNARKVRLLASAILISILSRDPEKAALNFIRKADLEAGGKATVSNLSNIEIPAEVMEDSDFRLRFGIFFERQLLARASCSSDRIAVGKNLGGALFRLGINIVEDPILLHQAIETYQKVETEISQKYQPVEWSDVRCQIGRVLNFLYKREHNIEYLKDAIQAQQIALDVRPRKLHPIKWAKNQLFLADVLQQMGVKTASPDMIKDSIQAYHYALEELHISNERGHHVSAQNNLQNAIDALGEIGEDSINPFFLN